MILLICFLLLIGTLAACARIQDQMQEQTGYTTAVPSSYKTASDHPGTVTRLDYDSKDYVGNGAAITKTAYVYTPYGYDENDEENRYNIVYLMHGWGGHAGEYFEFTSTKNMFDHLIENGDIPPMIIVSATFYNENSNTDFSGSIAEFRQFHRDFEENLMTAVEGRFLPGFGYDLAAVLLRHGLYSLLPAHERILLVLRYLRRFPDRKKRGLHRTACEG